MRPSGRARSVRGALLAFVLLAVGCGRDGAATLARSLARSRASCLVIVLDAAAAGHVGAYGYARPTTPHLDALAAEGVLFERTYSQGAGTVVSVPSYLSGLYPRTLAGRQAAAAGPPRYLAERFRAAGFRTAGFSENPYVGAVLGLDAGFDRFREFPPARTRAARLATSAALVSEVLATFAEAPDARLFAYVHLLRPHYPYEAPDDVLASFAVDAEDAAEVDLASLWALDRGSPAGPGQLERVVSLYDANFAYADRLVGELMEGLAALGVLDRTLVLVTADHGEAFGQHGRFLHGRILYDEVIRVPLVVRLPPAVAVPPGRAQVPVGLVDVVPTLVELFGLGAEDALDGRSLVPLVADPRAPWGPRVVFAQTRGRVAAVGSGYKLILSGRRRGSDRVAELYALADDDAERRNLADVPLAAAAALRGGIMTFLDGRTVAASIPRPPWRARGHERQRLDPAVRGQLRALGYVD